MSISGIEMTNSQKNMSFGNGRKYTAVLALNKDWAEIVTTAISRVAESKQGSLLPVNFGTPERVLNHLNQLSRANRPDLVVITDHSASNIQSVVDIAREKGCKPEQIIIISENAQRPAAKGATCVQKGYGLIGSFLEAVQKAFNGN